MSLLAACSTSVRPVDYRLPGRVSGLLALTKVLPVTGCDVSGMSLLTRANRYAAMSRYVEQTRTAHTAHVPAFSLVAVADAQHISTGLRSAWDFLRTFSLDQDSQVIAEEAIVPGATYLGTVKADHWAIALPFDEVSDPQTRAAVVKLVDRNRFPRAALLRAIVEYVIADQGDAE